MGLVGVNDLFGGVESRPQSIAPIAVVTTTTVNPDRIVTAIYGSSRHRNKLHHCDACSEQHNNDDQPQPGPLFHVNPALVKRIFTS